MLLDFRIAIPYEYTVNSTEPRTAVRIREALMAVDFRLSEDQLLARSATREFAKRHLSGVEDLIRGLPTPERRLLATKPVYEDLVRAGFLRAMIPARDGGTMTSLLDVVVTGEELSTGDVSVTCSLFSSGLGLYPIVIGGSERQRRTFLAPFVTETGAPMASLAFSEAGGSANFDDPHPQAGVQTTAVRDGDEWVINGHKAFTTNGYGWNGEGPDLFTVACRVDPALPPDQSLTLIVVPRPSRGLSFGASLDTIGHRACLSPRVSFRGVRVPVHNLIGARRATGADDPRSHIRVVGGHRRRGGAVHHGPGARRRARVRQVTDTRNGSRADHRAPERRVHAHRHQDAPRCRAGTWCGRRRTRSTSPGGHRTGAAETSPRCSAPRPSVQVVYDAMRLVGVESYVDGAAVRPADPGTRSPCRSTTAETSAFAGGCCTAS